MVAAFFERFVTVAELRERLVITGYVTDPPDIYRSPKRGIARLDAVVTTLLVLLVIVAILFHVLIRGHKVHPAVLDLLGILSAKACL